jgi:uncharacterized membrane protein YphA (DoxX/SURF4 family)
MQPRLLERMRDAIRYKHYSIRTEQCYLGWAATAIFLFLIPVTLVFHNFWALADQERFMQLIQFQKNLAIMGGMLYVMVYGSGAYSLGREKC